VPVRRRLRNERGDAAIEAVLATPVLLLLIMVVFQFGLWYHASHVAEAAAQEGTRAVRVDGGSAEDGSARAREFMTNAAPTLVGDVKVTATRNLETAHVEVSGTVRSLIPGVTLHVRGEADSPVERFRADEP
jgi:Flp pilus assembly protein TadG